MVGMASVELGEDVGFLIRRTMIGWGRGLLLGCLKQ